MAAFSDFFDEFLGEGGDVGGFAAGDEAVVADDFAVFPEATGVFDVAGDGFPGGEAATGDEPGVDQDPRGVANGADGFARLGEVADEGERGVVGAEGVGVHQAAGEHEGVEFLGFGGVEREIDVEDIAFVGVLHGLDRFACGRDNADGGAGLFEGFFGALEFGLFKSIGGEYGDVFVE